MADWVFQNAIVREQSFRGKSYQDAVGKFSSFLEVNLAYVQMSEEILLEMGGKIVICLDFSFWMGGWKERSF